MPTSADERADALVDTSVAIAIVLADHEGHQRTIEAVRGLRLGLAGHAWFESYSVLTRLPPGQRRSPADVRSILEHDFPASVALDATLVPDLRRELGDLAIAGGAVYDALVGAAARAARLTLLSRDRRARGIYEMLRVDVRFID